MKTAELRKAATAPKARGLDPKIAAATRHGRTFVLAMVFLIAFVLYYFINWKYLSTLWGLS